MADNDLSGNDKISPEEEDKEHLQEDENSDGAEEDQDGSSEALEEGKLEHDDEKLGSDENSDGAEENQDRSSRELEEDKLEQENETLGSDEQLTEAASSEDDVEPSEKPNKNSHKKLIAISSVVLSVLIFLTTGGIIYFGLIFECNVR